MNDAVNRLHRAVSAGKHLTVSRLIIDDALSVDASDPLGFTPLHFAAMFGDVHMVQLLLSFRPNINAATSEKAGRDTPLMCAALFSRSEVVKLLLDLGADLSPEDRWGRTALDLSSSPAITRQIALAGGQRGRRHSAYSYSPPRFSSVRNLLMWLGGECVNWLSGWGAEKLERKRSLDLEEAVGLERPKMIRGRPYDPVPMPIPPGGLGQLGAPIMTVYSSSSASESESTDSSSDEGDEHDSAAKVLRQGSISPEFNV